MSLVNLFMETVERERKLEWILPRTELDNTNAKVRVVDAEIVGDTPHDDKMNILLLEFPGYGTTGTSKPAFFIIHHHHHLTVTREHFSLVVT